MVSVVDVDFPLSLPAGIFLLFQLLGPLAEEEGSSEATAGCDKGRREGKEAQHAALLVSLVPAAFPAP